MKKFFFITLSLLAVICFAVYLFLPTSNHRQDDPNKDLPKVTYTENYQPKMKGYLTRPLTVENTEIEIRDPSVFKSVKPVQHAAIVQFMNGIMQSDKNRLMSSYNWLTAPDCMFKLICKKPDSNYINIQVYDRFIKTSDDEWIIPEPYLLKDLLDGIFYEK